MSLLIKDPEAHDRVMVMGPLRHDMACYPFLDVCHQIRRLGVKKGLAEHYARVLHRGGAVVCVETPDVQAVRLLDALNAQDVMV